MTSPIWVAPSGTIIFELTGVTVGVVGGPKNTFA